jgi:hypothetical protein
MAPSSLPVRRSSSKSRDHRERQRRFIHHHVPGEIRSANDVRPVEGEIVTTGPLEKNRSADQIRR